DEISNARQSLGAERSQAEPGNEHQRLVTAVSGTGAVLVAGVVVFCACTRRISLPAALLAFVSKLPIHALKRTWAKTSGMAVTRPRAVAKRARPMAPLLDVIDCPFWVSSWISEQVPIMLMTVARRPTIVAILAMARMVGRRKLRSGRTSSSMLLAMARRMAAMPCLLVSSPPARMRLGMRPGWLLQKRVAPSTPSLLSF